MNKRNGFHSASFSDQDLVKALNEASAAEHANSDPGLSVRELMKSLGLGRSALMIRLQDGVECGSVLVGTRIGRNITNVKCRTPVYRMAKKLKTKKAKK